MWYCVGYRISSDMIEKRRLMPTKFLETRKTWQMHVLEPERCDICMGYRIPSDMIEKRRLCLINFLKPKRRDRCMSWNLKMRYCMGYQIPSNTTEKRWLMHRFLFLLHYKYLSSLLLFLFTFIVIFFQICARFVCRVYW